MTQHIPVLAKEILDQLQLKPGMTVVDGTVGLGGHAALMLQQIGPNGKLIGFDRDARNLALAKDNLKQFSSQVTLVNDSFAHMSEHVAQADAILLDLGFSSVHVDDPTRGFSFMTDGPLDMRYDQRQTLTAEAIVNSWSRDELATLFRRYGEEPRAVQIAKAIFEARREQRITTTGQLADIVSAVVPRRGKTHPATKVFQALRIAVNDELGEVEKGLAAVVNVLKPGGRLAVISFHSLEDRTVKLWLKKQETFVSLSKKPIVPTRAEVISNPRARSAKLRVAERR